MTLEPLGERVVVRRKINKKKGMIYIPDKSQKVSFVGRVECKGKDCVLVEVGDQVLFATYSGYEPQDLGDNYKDCLVMNEGDILAKIKEGSDE